jgi:hypothetical protein
MMDPVILERFGLWEPSEKGCHGSYVLAHPGKVRESIIILDDPPVHVAGHRACTSTVFAAFDLALELRALLL